MKKILISIALVLSTMPAMAQHHGYHGKGLGPYHHNHNYRHHSGPGIGWWIAPIVTGVIGYEIAKQQQIVVQQPVIVQNPPMIAQQSCSPWTETQHTDGTITRTRTCQQ
jgi:hypothetical protein